MVDKSWGNVLPVQYNRQVESSVLVGEQFAHLYTSSGQTLHPGIHDLHTACLDHSVGQQQQPVGGAGWTVHQDGLQSLSTSHTGTTAWSGHWGRQARWLGYPGWPLRLG